MDGDEGMASDGKSTISNDGEMASDSEKHGFRQEKHGLRQGHGLEQGERYGLRYRSHDPGQEETQPWAVKNSFSPVALGTVSAKCDGSPLPSLQRLHCPFAHSRQPGKAAIHSVLAHRKDCRLRLPQC